MATFKDASGKQWTVEFDGLALGDVLEETGIDLAQPSGLVQVAEHPPSLAQVLAVLCREQFAEGKMSARDFSRGLRGEALTAAFDAVFAAARDFFPPQTWTEVTKRFAKQRQFANSWQEVGPMLRRLHDLPPSMQEAVMKALAEMLDTDPRTLAGLLSSSPNE